MFNSNTDWNTSDITQYFPFNYTTVKSIVDTSSFCGARNIDVIRFGGDNNAWYRKYSNGFIEQGGRQTCSLSYNGSNSGASIIVTLPISFTTTKYQVVITPGNYYTSCYVKSDENTTSTTKIWFSSVADNTVTLTEFSWYACGY